MTPTRKSHSSSRDASKTLLATLKLTTTVGAVSLTMAAWALLSQTEALNAANSAQTTTAAFTNNALSTRPEISSLADMRLDTVRNAATATATDALPTTTPRTAAVKPEATTAPTTLPTDLPTDLPTATPTTAPTATPEPKFKLDIVQWVKTNAGDPVAVVRDNRGVLWYVWGVDVPRIEQGLSPQYRPQPVNRVGRTRHS